MAQADVKFITVYSAYETTDEMGRTGGCIGHFSDPSSANIAAQGKGWYGGEGKVLTHSAVCIDGEVYLLKSNEPVDLDGKKEQVRKQLAAQALAKLSDVEKEALGLK